MKKLLLIIMISIIHISLYGMTKQTEVPPPDTPELNKMIKDIIDEYDPSEAQYICMQIETNDDYNTSGCSSFCGTFFKCRMQFLEIQYKISNLIRHSQSIYEQQKFDNSKD